MDRPTRTRKGRAPAALAILGAAALVAASLLLAAEGARAGDDRRTIATVASNGFRVQVEAVRTPGGGGAPGARVRIAAFERRGGAWARLGRALPVRPAPGAEEFFWKVVTAPGALRDLSVTTAAPQRISLRLLISPSVGVSPISRFHVEDGALVRG